MYKRRNCIVCRIKWASLNDIRSYAGEFYMIIIHHYGIPNYVIVPLIIIFRYLSPSHSSPYQNNSCL